MRYRELLEDQAEMDAPAPTDAVAEKPVAQTKVYFHVTTKQRLKSIQQNGIEPNHNRRWKTGFGKTLGDRGNIYLMSDFTAAVRWAHKQEWEHFNGKVPDPSPYIIICVREDPKTLEPDPHPENGLYGHSWFQKKGSIAPQDIMKVIPLTRALIKQVVNGGQAVMERTLSGVTSHYSPRKCIQALTNKGWLATSTPNMFKNPDYPEYSIDLDIHNPNGDGPFTVYRHNEKLGVVSTPPVAQHMGLKDKLTDRLLQEPDPDEWDFQSLA